MRIFRYAAVAASALALLAVGFQANASPIGTTYTVLVSNIGGAGNPLTTTPLVVTLTFDLTQKAIPGSSLVIQERAVPLGIGVGTNFDPTNPALVDAQTELIDIWIKDTGASAGSFATNVPVNFLPSAIVVSGLSWPANPAGFRGISVANSGFVWFTNDDVEVPMTPIDPNVAVGLFPHPFTGTGLDLTPLGAPVSEVLFTGSAQVDPFSQIGIATSVFGPTVTWADLELGLGINGLGVNDLHVGVLVAEVPEPGTLVLLGLGLAAVASGLRRRSS